MRTPFVSFQWPTSTTCTLAYTQFPTQCERNKSQKVQGSCQYSLPSEKMNISRELKKKEKKKNVNTEFTVYVVEKKKKKEKEIESRC